MVGLLKSLDKLKGCNRSGWLLVEVRTLPKGQAKAKQERRDWKDIGQAQRTSPQPSPALASIAGFGERLIPLTLWTMGGEGFRFHSL